MLLNDMHTDWNDKDNNTDPVLVALQTSGGGYWSTHARLVGITSIELVPYDVDYGELKVYFNTDTWRPDQHGLIYTDPMFKEQLVQWLISLGFAGGDVGYSEQGMQGDNYVSLDAGEAFVKSYIKNKKEDWQRLNKSLLK